MPVLRLRRGAVKVFTRPSFQAPRRGLVGGPRSVLPLLERRKAPGCRGDWYRIGIEAWACSRRLRPGTGRPRGVHHPQLRLGRLMPRSYVITRRRVVVRRQPRHSAPAVRTLREGSGLVIRQKVPGQGGLWRRTRLGYLPKADLRVVRPSRLVGVHLTPTTRLPISWINGATAWITSAPSVSRRLRVGGLQAYRRVRLLQVKKVGRRSFARIGPHRWVPAERVRTAHLRRRPPQVKAGERWIHVSLQDWTLVAYEGDRPVFATLISRGWKTPRGYFRVTRKLAISTLRFQTRSGVYEAEAVPWVVYFKPHYAFHSAYWHDGFGDRASHGCVNLSPSDARWIFEWTRPALPAGWYQVHASPADPGTHVLIE